MTVSETDNKQRTTGNGVTVAFPATIKIFAETDITVKTIVIATDIKANDLILNDGGALGFTVVFDTDAETLTVTVNTAPTSLEDIQILRVLPITQTTDFPVATKFPAVSSENAHDKNTMILQDQQEQLDRAFVLPEESSATNPSLPAPTSRRALIWDPAEDGTIINSAKDPDAAQTDAAASATAASSSEGNAATSATNAATSATNAATSATNAATSETNAAASANSQIRFAFAASTSMADPGAGNFRMNNATVANVTAIAFDATMNQTGNPDISDYLATWDDSTNTVKGQLTLIKNGEPETFALFNVTAVADNTGWLQITVVHVASNGTFSASDNIDTFFARSGDLAAAGGAWNLIGTVLASGSANITVTGLDSTFDTYAIAWSDIIPQTDTSELHLRVGDSGGIDSAASDYSYHIKTSDHNNNGYVGNATQTDSKILLGDNVGNATGEGAGGLVLLHSPADATGFPKITGTMMWINSGTFGRGGSMSAYRTAVITLDRIQILFSSGNIASGRLTVWGISHA